jgi:hypothetical protein
MKALLFAAIFSSCVHGIGDTCTTGEAYCGPLATDPKAALVCKDDKLARFECAGPNGCTRNGERDILCDQSSGAKPATLCLDEGTAQCSPDAASYLACKAGSWVQVACLVGTKCRSKDGWVGCAGE